RTVGKLSRMTRRQEMLVNVKLGGVSAMYIKICDFLHNISRVRQSPPLLIEKAIERGRSEYASFFRQGLGGELEREFSARVESAAAELRNVRERTQEKSGPVEYAELVTFCTRSASGKRLEAHDIVRLL